MPAPTPELRLAHGLAFADLHSVAGAQRVDALFCAHLAAADGALAARLASGRADPKALAPKAESELLLAVAPHLEDFLAELFGIETEVRALEAAHHERAPLFAVKRLFVQRKAMNAYKADVAATFDGAALARELGPRIGAVLPGRGAELAFAQAVTAWQADEAAHAADLDLAQRYAAWAAHTPEGRAAHVGGVLFRAPRKLDFMRLVPVASAPRAGRGRRRRLEARRRPPAPPRGLRADRRGDGLHRRPRPVALLHLVPRAGQGLLRQGAAGEATRHRRRRSGRARSGCRWPAVRWRRRISEFHKLRAEGWPVAALAMVCVDNPMVAGTGHRICNDCMKSCIYQKTDPVDIPQAETRLLKDVLALPWGFELYSLLTRWNPLNLAPSGAARADGTARADRRHGAGGDTPSRTTSSTTATPSSASTD